MILGKNAQSRVINMLRIFIFLIFCVGSATAGSLRERLNIHSIHDAWEINTSIQGQAIRLSMPEELPLLDQYPSELSGYIQKKIQYRKKNIELLSRYAQDTENLLLSKTFRQKLEYERSLKEIVVSIHPSDGNRGDPLFRHWSLFDKLPEYTQIHIFVPVELLDSTSKIIKESRFKDRKIKLHEVKTWALNEEGNELIHATTRWAQDLLETTSDSDGEKYIIAPATRYQIHDLSRADNDYLASLASSNRKLLRTPFFFRSGNIVVAKSEKRVLFIGRQELINNNNDFYNAVFERSNPEEFVATIKQLLGADVSVVLPNSKNLFHVDLYVAFVSDGTAILIDPVDPYNLSYEDKEALEIAEALLKRNGFEIVRIPTTASRIKNHQSPVNIVLFKDEATGQTHALVPLFEDIILDDNVSLNELTEASYLKSGIKPIPVSDQFHFVNGNTHCAVSVLQ